MGTITQDGQEYDDADALEQAVSVLTCTFVVWDESKDPADCMDHAKPSFLGVYRDLRERAKRLGEMPDEDSCGSDEEFLKLRASLKRKTEADGSASSSGSGSAGEGEGAERANTASGQQSSEKQELLVDVQAPLPCS